MPERMDKLKKEVDHKQHTCSSNDVVISQHGDAIGDDAEHALTGRAPVQVSKAQRDGVLLIRHQPICRRELVCEAATDAVCVVDSVCAIRRIGDDQIEVLRSTA